MKYLQGAHYTVKIFAPQSMVTQKFGDYDMLNGSNVWYVST